MVLIKCRTLTLYIIWTSLVQECESDANGGCGYNKVKVRNDCADCPIGYFGKNCSEKCSPPGYGELCSQTCDCVSCHHIFGCNETEVTTEARTTEQRKSETTVTYAVINKTTQSILETLQSTRKQMASGSPVHLAIYNTTNQRIRSKLKFFKL